MCDLNHTISNVVRCVFCNETLQRQFFCPTDEELEFALPDCAVSFDVILLSLRGNSPRPKQRFGTHCAGGIESRRKFPRLHTAQHDIL